MITFSKMGCRGERLANQIFEFCAGYSISKKINTSFTFNKNSDLFNCFNLNKNYVYINKNINKIYEEPSFTYNEGFFDIKDDTDIYGYFQCERYFADYKFDILNAELVFFNDIYQTSKNILIDVKNKFHVNDVVSIHVRRSDYFLYQYLYKMIDMEYYNKAMSYFNKNSAFIIFSDDIEWCKTQFNGNNIYFSNNNKYIDLCLMSLCDHNVIANSTFSWWGSYLNKNPNKIIISPKKWFIKDSMEKDIILPNWILI